jgi:hypothetical protein
VYKRQTPSGNAAFMVANYADNKRRFDSYAMIADAGRVAAEMGNSATVIFARYRELVKPADAGRWFAVKPEAPANVLTMPVAGVSP